MKITIEHKEKQSEDIFKPGSLVVSKLDSVVILVTMDTALAEGRFAGVTLNHSRQHAVAEYQTDWLERHFIKYLGTVTLEQE